MAAVNQSITVPGLQTSHFRVNPSSGILVERLASLNIQAGGAVVVDTAANHANRQLLVFSSGLTLGGTTGNWTGRLDLTNNDLDLAGASLSTVTDQVREGFNGGTWNSSSGIVSSSAAGNRLAAIGVMQNNQSGSPIYSGSHLFDGIAPGASDVLVKYTYFGDANLDGKVDASDYSRIDSAYLAGQSGHPMTGWFNGDFNYDGVINGSDYTLIDNAFNTQGASLAVVRVLAEIAANPRITAIVPEPSGILFLTGMVVVVLGKTWRRKAIAC